jgi:hypothetical protein
VRAAAMDPNVFLTVAFVSWVAVFGLAVAAVVRHERSRAAATPASESPATDATQAEATQQRSMPPSAEDEARIVGAELGETPAVLKEAESGKSH